MEVKPTDQELIIKHYNEIPDENVFVLWDEVQKCELKVEKNMILRRVLFLFNDSVKLSENYRDFEIETVLKDCYIKSRLHDLVRDKKGDFKNNEESDYLPAWLLDLCKK